MDSNISDLLSKVLSNPEMLERVTTLLPVVTNLMNGDKEANPPKTIETIALQNNAGGTPPRIDPQPSSPPQSPPPSSSSSSSIPLSFSAENLMTDANVMSAFKNFIDAINSAQKPLPPPNPEPAQTTSQSVDSEPPPDDAVAASTLGNILGKLNGSMKATSTPLKQQDADDTSTDDNSPAIEKTLDTLKKISSMTTPEKDDRIKLLLALKPFLKDSRKGKVDTAIKYMGAAKILNIFGKTGFV